MAVDYERVRRFKAVTSDGPSTWPQGVRSISLNGLALLGIDDAGLLYWDGQRLEIAKTVSLSWWQTLFAAMTAIGTFLAGIAVILPLFGVTRLV